MINQKFIVLKEKVEKVDSLKMGETVHIESVAFGETRINGKCHQDKNGDWKVPVSFQEYRESPQSFYDEYVRWILI